MSLIQCWANPNRDWDLNRDLSIFWEWFDNFWEWFNMKDWDLIRFVIFCDSIWGATFDSRILASCRSTVESAAAARNAATTERRSSWLIDSSTFYQTSTLASFIRNFILDFLKLKLPWLNKYWLSGLTVLTTNLGLGFDWDSEFWDWDLLVRFGIGI